MSTTTIVFDWYVGQPGVLTDATTVILTDPTSTFGVRRTDNQAVVVAAGTAMNHTATGQYSITFTDPAPGLTYESQIQVVYGGNTYYYQRFSSGAGTGGNYVSTFTLFDLQNMLSVSARNAKSSLGYSYYQKDLAIYQAAQRWRELTKATRRVDPVTLTVGSSDLPSIPSGFQPEFELNLYLTLAGQYISPDIRIVPIEQVLQDQHCGPNAGPRSGQPRRLGFDTRSTAQFDTLVDKAYQLNFAWWEDFTTWTLGQAFVSANLSTGAIASFNYAIPGSIYTSAPTITITDPTGTGFVAGAVTLVKGGITAIAISAAGTGYTNPTVFINGVRATLPTFNLPNEHLLPIATMGAKYFLQQGESANAAAAQAAKVDFENEARRFVARGAGGLGVRVIEREPPDWMRGCGGCR